jgi:hypothetical protein
VVKRTRKRRTAKTGRLFLASIFYLCECVYKKKLAEILIEIIGLCFLKYFLFGNLLK